MKQETGNDIPDVLKKLSIQVGLNGFSFSISQAGSEHFRSLFYPHFDLRYLQSVEYRLVEDFHAVEIGWSTDLVTLVPVEIFDEGICPQYMKAANMLKEGTTTLHYRPSGSFLVAIWQADTAMFETVREIYPNAYHYHYLLTGIDAMHRDTIEVIILRDTAHIKVYNSNGLFAAESTRYISLEDILWYVKKLSGGDSFSQYKFNLIAPDFPEATDFFSVYYRNLELYDFSELF